MNIKKLKMWKSICNDMRIHASNSLFGLRTIASYTPTNSIIYAKTIEFSPTDGKQLKDILESPRTTLVKAIGNFRPKATVNGNYMAEVCASEDNAFVAVQLYQFSRMSYEPVTNILCFEGEEAHAVKQLF